MAKDQSKVQKERVRGGQSGFSGGELNTHTLKGLLVLPTARTDRLKLKGRRRHARGHTGRLHLRRWTMDILETHAYDRRQKRNMVPTQLAL